MAPTFTPEIDSSQNTNGLSVLQVFFQKLAASPISNRAATAKAEIPEINILVSSISYEPPPSVHSMSYETSALSC